MGYEDLVGAYARMGQEMDIVGQNGQYPNYQCAPVPMGMPGMPGPVPPPVTAGPFGYPGFPGPLGGFPLAAAPLGGYPAVGPGLPFAPGVAAAEAAALAGYPGGFPGYPGYGWPWAGCFAPPVAPLLTQRVEEPALLLRPRCPTRLRTQYLGFPRTCIPACSTVEIECDVQVLTKIIRLVFPSDSAFQLLVHDIKIGNECLVQCGPIPASMFLEDATDAEVINTETIQPGTSVRITVQNVSNADVCLSIGAIVRVAF